MTTASEPQSAVIVKLTVHHGDYMEDFYGAGATVLAAAEDASGKSSYSSGLFSITDSFYTSRAKFRDALAEALEARQEYRGYGWCTYRRVA